ncbi:MAG: hypothetical protein ACR2KS_11985 [Candidatus Eremiobacter antarcticus]|nr:hypothetical protein [Candidatus Eremiobacteraeota bacterium]
MALSSALKAQAPSFSHCRAMLDRFGMVQFAIGEKPDLSFGYCVDDNARAFLASALALHLRPGSQDARIVGEAALKFLELSQRGDGLFHNLMDEQGAFTDDIGSEDCFGRAVWACGVASRCAPVAEWRERSRGLLGAALKHVDGMRWLRPRSYAVLGLAAAADPHKGALFPPAGDDCDAGLQASALSALRRQCSRLALEFQENAAPHWQWWEPQLTWGNARPAEALIRAATVTADACASNLGMQALRFLASVTHERDMFLPIGNEGWYVRGGRRAVYDQQPIEACGMVDAWLAAARLTGDAAYRTKALEAFGWFLGLNSEGLVVAEVAQGGCRDGLRRGGVNPNMGAESTLSYVHAHIAIAGAFRHVAAERA